MRLPAILLGLGSVLAASGSAPNRLEAVRAGLQQLRIDKDATWRVRELELSRGGARIYFSEGVLAFATPVDGQRVAAVFTTAPVEAGDGEIIALPPLAAERASLARFTKTPNLDEHFTSALLFFAGDIGTELLNQIHSHPLHPAPGLAAEVVASFEAGLRSGASEIDVRLTQSILDRHGPAKSFIYAMMSGRTLGAFDFIFQPDQPDQSMFGRVAGEQTPSFFQIWAALRPKKSSEDQPLYQITDYHIDTTIHLDLSMSAHAEFDYQADADDGAIITLLLTPRLRVTAASIDDVAAAVVMHDSPLTKDVKGAATFLLVSATELSPASHHRVRIDYEGSVIHRTPKGAYFVDERNAWYPFMETMLTVFDLTFHCPQGLQLVASGDPLSEGVANGERTVHRRTTTAKALAGFNLGEFDISSSVSAPYSIEICANPTDQPPPDLARQTAGILQYFTKLWSPLPNHHVAVAPIEGYFGQGFPGLIYLSDIAYMRERDRPAALRNARFDSFFSQLLLPHELAHQWWGNIVTPADYRATWIVEALANYTALQYLEQAHGRPVLDAILAAYRTDLITPRADGALIDSNGPVTFGQRLLNNFGMDIWHDVLYEKGTWIFHMLRRRMGDAAFHDFQVKVLHDFSARPISTEDLRQEAARFSPASQPDRELIGFFDTWVNDTGIPALAIRNGKIRVSEVADSYTVDVPLSCAGLSRWVRLSEGTAPLPLSGCTLPSSADFLFRDSK